MNIFKITYKIGKEKEQSISLNTGTLVFNYNRSANQQIDIADCLDLFDLDIESNILENLLETLSEKAMLIDFTMCFYISNNNSFIKLISDKSVQDIQFTILNIEDKYKKRLRFIFK